MAQQTSSDLPKDFLLDDVEQTHRRVGAGSYGAVFLGTWNGLNVAIKRHHPMLIRDEYGRFSQPYERFLEEFPMLRNFPHPSIVQVFGMVPAPPNGSPGLVMEYLPVTLRERYKQEPLFNRAQEISVAHSVICGLRCLHGRKLLHRDLTTANIMLTEHAGMGAVRAKITDIGGARMQHEHSDAEKMTINPGAQCYMAPETQREVDSGKARYGPAMDLYAFGVSMLAMCVRREPPSMFVLAKQGRTKDINDMKTDHPLYLIIIQCIVDEPDERPLAVDLSIKIGAVNERFNPPLAATPSPTTEEGTGLGEEDGIGGAEARLRFKKLEQELQSVNADRELLAQGRKELEDSLARTTADLEFTTKQRSIAIEERDAALALSRQLAELDRLRTTTHRKIAERWQQNDQLGVKLQRRLTDLEQRFNESSQEKAPEFVPKSPLSGHGLGFARPTTRPVPTSRQLMERSVRLFSSGEWTPDLTEVPAVSWMADYYWSSLLSSTHWEDCNK